MEKDNFYRDVITAQKHLGFSLPLLLTYFFPPTHPLMELRLSRAVI